MDKRVKNIIEGVELTKLSEIPHPKGNIYHALKASDDSYVGFGEAYFTNINCGEIKGWKKHNRMTLNLIVPLGVVDFYIYDEKSFKKSRFRLGHNNYFRLTIRPDLWVAFEGISTTQNLILNIGSIEHDPSESINASIDTYPMDKNHNAL